ncbi:MAG: hypothetical protein KZQ94_22325 [Candidatus Thiodiazotropha sp. (ex Troendleina suluensis)]|nr:hypothetical protein [Candidatus Thiodiazotropha sp. (ex Troendleina suluensis)]
MKDVQYWVFNEAQLDTALRKWTQDPRHSDISDEAVKARFEAVSGFLYSDIASDDGLRCGFDLKHQTSTEEVSSDR